MVLKKGVNYMVSISFNRNKYVFTHIPMMLISSNADKAEKSKEISMFLKELEEYNVVFKDLVNFPLSEDKRNLSLNIAYYLVENTEIQDKLIRKKAIPFKELSVSIRISISNLEKLNDYIIAYYIIVSNLKYRYLQEHLKVKLRDDNKVVSLDNKKYPIKKGIVITSKRKTACILTPEGEFFKIKTNISVHSGEISEGRESTRIGKYKVQISIFLVILTLICSGFVVKYNKVDRMIVVKLSSSIKLHVNKFDKVVYIYSPTERGQEFIKQIDVENKDLDYALSEIFDKGIQNEMIDKSTKVLMTVTGNPLQYGELTETQKVVGKNSISVVINNAGNQQTLPKYEEEKEE